MIDCVEQSFFNTVHYNKDKLIRIRNGETAGSFFNKRELKNLRRNGIIHYKHDNSLFHYLSEKTKKILDGLELT